MAIRPRATIIVLTLILLFRASPVLADAILTANSILINPNTTPFTIQIKVSNNDYADPDGSVFGQLSASFTGGGSLVVTAYADDTNTLFGQGIPIDTATVFPYTGALVPFMINSPYALTLVSDVTVNPMSTVNLSAILRVSSSPVAVPEPSSSLLVLAGAGVLGLIRFANTPLAMCGDRLGFHSRGIEIRKDL